MVLNDDMNDRFGAMARSFPLVLCAGTGFVVGGVCAREL